MKGEAAAQLHVEGDGGVLRRIEAHPNRPQRFDDPVVDGPDVGARGIRRQSTPARTVHCSVPRHTPQAPSKTPRLVYGDAEDDLQRVVTGMRDRPDLLRPRRIRLAYRREGVTI